MKLVTTRNHALWDYAFGAILLLMAVFLSHGRQASVTLGVVGMAVIGYSLLTQYEFSLVKAITLKAHLSLDFLAGLVLIVLPFLMNPDNSIGWLITAFGFLEIVVVFMSQTQPKFENRTSSSHDAHNMT